MTKKDYYSVKDLIIGSREEYLKNERLLRSLRNLTDSYDENVKDFYFNLTKYDNRNPEIDCKFIQSFNTLKGILIYLQMKMGTYYYGRVFGQCLKNNNGEYFITSDEYNAFIKDGCMLRFAEIVDEILTSDFANKMNFSHIWEKEHNIVSIFPSNIYVTNLSLCHTIYFYYLAKKDLIDIKSQKRHVVDDELIMYVLNSRVPSNILSDYHRQKIDENLSIQKPIEIVSEVEDANRVQLLINETDDKVVLRKVRVNNKLDN